MTLPTPQFHGKARRPHHTHVLPHTRANSMKVKRRLKTCRIFDILVLMTQFSPELDQCLQMVESVASFGLN